VTQNSKHSAQQIQILSPSSKINSHLPAPIVNGKAERLWKWKSF